MWTKYNFKITLNIFFSMMSYFFIQEKVIIDHKNLARH